jgi:hypothetical protein
MCMSVTELNPHLNSSTNLDPNRASPDRLPTSRSPVACCAPPHLPHSPVTVTHLQPNWCPSPTHIDSAPSVELDSFAFELRLFLLVLI